jgi:outer membrane protein assembly factor BamA
VTVAHAHDAARAHALIVLVFLASACHHKPPHHPGEEWLDAIRFEGNHAISSKDLREGLALHRVQDIGGAPDPYLVTVDGDRIKGQYLRAGYLEVDVHSRVERHGDAVTVIYKIDEGIRSTTKTVITGIPDGDPKLTVEKVRELLPLQEGKPFTYEPYDKAKESLLGIAEDAGYAHAKLDAKIVADRVNHEAVVTLTYDLGPKCHFGKITVEGAPPDLQDAVRARLAFETGQQFSAAAIAKSQRAIYAMQRFSTVRILPDKSDGETVDVHVSLSHANSHELSLGGGFGIDPATYEVRGRVGYSQTGWPAPLYRFDFDGRPAYAVLRDGSGYEPRVRALAKLSRMDLFYPRVTGELEGGYAYEVLESYTQYGPHLRLGANSPLGTPEVKLAVSWRLERYDFSHVNNLIDPMLQDQIGLNSTERNGAFDQTLILDLRDNPLEPHLGVYSEVRVSEGGAYAAGNLDYTEVVPEVRGYLPVPYSGVVLAGRFRYGAIYGDIPVSERFYSGGASSQRGFSERRLSPTVFGMNDNGEITSRPFGGAGMVDTSVEVRAQLGTIKKMGVGGVVFLDGGDVTETPSEIDMGNLHWAAGGGLRLFTVLGAIRFDVGYRLNRTGPMEPEPGSHYAFHLSIGEAY